MPKIYTSRADEELIDVVLRKGLQSPGHKWTVLRIALALSLRLTTEPAEDLDEREGGGSEYAFEQLTGEGQDPDYTDAYCGLLSTYYKKNLFDDQEEFRRLLQRHVRRGLREIGASWTESHNFHEYLLQELFSDVAVQDEPSEDLEQRLTNALSDIGVTAEIKGHVHGPRVTRFSLFLPDVNDLDRLRRGLDKISFYLGLGQQKVFEAPTNESRIVGLDVPREQPSWELFKGADFRAWAAKPPKGYALPVWLGVDALGEPVAFDLSEAPHLLVGGTTGSGKSICLHAILLSLITTQRMADLSVCLIDPKHVEFQSYKSLPNLYKGEVITEHEEALEALNELVFEMGIREQLFADLGVRNYEEACEQKKQSIPRIVVFIEELADLLMQGGDIEAPIIRLAQKARAVGIHLVLATQRPDSKGFSGLLRSNIPSRIALTVQKSSESKIILDDLGAERLMGKGDMLLRLIGDDIRRVHGVYIGRDDIAAGIKALTSQE